METLESLTEGLVAVENQPYLNSTRIVVWALGAAIIAFCMYMFLKGRKQQKAKREAMADRSAENQTSEDE